MVQSDDDKDKVGKVVKEGTGRVRLDLRGKLKRREERLRCLIKRYWPKLYKPPKEESKK